MTSQGDCRTRGWSWEDYLGSLGLALFGVGSYLGLFVAPPDRFMGQVIRILYVHVPLLWCALLVLALTLFIGAAYLWTGRGLWDAVLVAAIEVGVVLTLLGLLTGMIWARPTWGVWWAWDVRMTWTFILLVVFVGVLLLRRLLADAARRATWSAVAAILASVNAPLVYFSVSWWQSLHQIQSTAESLDPGMVMPLRLNGLSLLLLSVWLVSRRTRFEIAQRSADPAT